MNLTDPPEWMSESQKQGWIYAIENAPDGLLKKLDRSVLVAWVVAEDLHRQASMHAREVRNAYQGAEYRAADAVTVPADRQQASSHHAEGCRAVGLHAGVALTSAGGRDAIH